MPSIEGSRRTAAHRRARSLWLVIWLGAWVSAAITVTTSTAQQLSARAP